MSNLDPIYGRRVLDRATAWLINLPRGERNRVMTKVLLDMGFRPRKKK